MHILTMLGTGWIILALENETAALELLVILENEGVLYIWFQTMVGDSEIEI